MSITVQTKLGRSLRTNVNPDAPPQRVPSIVKHFSSGYLGVVMRRPPTGGYNCHGLVFANRRARIYELEDLDWIRRDDGYREVDAADVLPGDIVVYYEAGEIAHTAIVLESAWVGKVYVPKLISKWGDAGEYLHSLSQSPYGNQVRYWTERP